MDKLNLSYYRCYTFQFCKKRFRLILDIIYVENNFCIMKIAFFFHLQMDCIARTRSNSNKPDIHQHVYCIVFRICLPFFRCTQLCTALSRPSTVSSAHYFLHRLILLVITFFSFFYIQIRHYENYVPLFLKKL